MTRTRREFLIGGGLAAIGAGRALGTGQALGQQSLRAASAETLDQVEYANRRIY